MLWKKLAQESELAEVLDRLNHWATDVDRFRRALLDPTSQTSLSTALALNQSLQVSSTRVEGLAAGSTGGGATITAGGSNFQVQYNLNGLLYGDTMFTFRPHISQPLLGMSGDLLLDGGIETFGGSTLSTGNRHVRVYGPFVLGDPGTGAYGASMTGGTTFDRVIIAQTLTSHGNIGVTGSVDIKGNLGVTALIMGSAGVSVTGGATFSSMGCLTGATFAGTVRLSGGTMVVTSGFGIEPSATATGSLGRSIRRWGNIFGSTGSITVLSGTSVGYINILGGVQTDASNAIFWCDTVGVTINGSLGLGTNFHGLDAGWFPLTDSTRSLGIDSGDPLRWSRIHGTHVFWSRAADVASGTTLYIGMSGNYTHVTGVSTVEGISYGPGANLVSGVTGSIIWLKLNGAARFSHHATRLILSGSQDAYGSTGDIYSFVCEGGNNFREISRHTKPRVEHRSVLPYPGTFTWQMTAAEQETAGDTRGRTFHDLSGYQYCRMQTCHTGGTTGAPGAMYYLQYSTDFSTWAALSAAGGSNPSVRCDVVGTTVGQWNVIAPTARQDVWLRIMGVSGDGAMTTVPGHIILELK